MRIFVFSRGTMSRGSVRSVCEFGIMDSRNLFINARQFSWFRATTTKERSSLLRFEVGARLDLFECS